MYVKQEMKGIGSGTRPEFIIFEISTDKVKVFRVYSKIDRVFFRTLRINLYLYC